MTTNTPTTLGVVGLGRMGANIARRLMADGHTTVVHDINRDAVACWPLRGRSVPTHWPTWSPGCQPRARSG